VTPVLDAESVRGHTGKTAVAFPDVDAVTFAACPSAVTDNDVGRSIFMSIRAVSARCQVLTCISSPCIHDMRDGVKVSRVDAPPNPTKVIKLQSCRNRTHVQFIRQPMRAQVVMGGSRSATDLAVSLSCRARRPQPARAKFGGTFRRRSGLVHLRPESFFEGKLSPHRILQWFGVTGTGVSAPRPLNYTMKRGGGVTA